MCRNTHVASFVVAAVPVFQLLYFHESVLERHEAVNAPDVLVAIEKAAGKPSHLKVEIWLGHRRVAEIGPSLVRPPVTLKRRRPN